jgi:SulP family sulfate permease
VADPGRAEHRGWLVPPGIVALRGHRRAWLRGDLLAGVTVAPYLIPQVMAYAQVAGLPAATGRWAVLPALVAYALLRSSSSLSMGARPP